MSAADPKEYRSQLIAFAGGKGGSGKTFLASSLGAILASHRRVVLVDLDLGGPNLHTAFGMERPLLTLDDFFGQRGDPLRNFVVETGCPNLKLVAGSNRPAFLANLPYARKLKLIRAIRRESRADFVILDLGSGTTFNVLDFFRIASVGAMIINPEPSSVENTYLFAQALSLRIVGRRLAQEKMLNSFHLSDFERRPIRETLAEIGRVNTKLASEVKRELYSLTLLLIVNKTRNPNDLTLGRQMVFAIREKLGLPAIYGGSVPFDFKINDSTRQGKSFVMNSPDSPSLRCIQSLSDSLLDVKPTSKGASAEGSG